MIEKLNFFLCDLLKLILTINVVMNNIPVALCLRCENDEVQVRIVTNPTSTPLPKIAAGRYLNTPTGFTNITGEPFIIDEVEIETIRILCVYNSPIKWIVTQLQNSSLEVARNFDRRTYKENSNGCQSLFESFFLLLYNLNDMHNEPVYAECQSILNPTVSSAIQITSDRFQSQLEFVPSRKLKEVSNDKILQPIYCPFQLLVAKDSNSSVLSYKWKHSPEMNLSDHIYLVSRNRVTHYKNLFPYQKQNSSACFSYLMQDQCNSCKRIFTGNIDAAVFHASNENVELVFQGVFGLKSRQFYLEHETPLDEKLILHLPNVAFRNQTTLITCMFSPYYYAYGTQIQFNQGSLPNSKLVVEYNPPGSVKVSTMIQPQDNQLLVTCIAPILFSSSFETLHKIVEVQDPVGAVIDSISFGSSSDDQLRANKGDNVTIMCIALGNPEPKVNLTTPSHGISKSQLESRKETYKNLTLTTHKVYLKLELFNITSSHAGIYTCVANNSFGAQSKSITLHLRTGLSTKGKIWLGSGTGGGIGVLLLGLGFLWRLAAIKKKKYKKQLEQIIKDFTEGRRGSSVAEVSNLFDQPYNTKFELSEEHWKIDEGTVLGQGHFGIVYYGVVTTSVKKLPVAIKMLKPGADMEDFNNFLLELKIMAYIGRVLIAVEFCSSGNVRQYLIRNKRVFDKKQNQYANVENVVSLTQLDLCTWCFQIAQGMEFLVSKKILHADLAARNVLLTSDKIAKISDFGLSRLLIDSPNYLKRSKGALPWRYMPPESLRHRIFSEASDVWAYGVTVWEIYSFGETPFAGHTYNEEFIAGLETNKIQLQKPKTCGSYIYEIMKTCWKIRGFDRPPFSKLKQQFSEILEEFNRTEVLDPISASSTLDTSCGYEYDSSDKQSINLISMSVDIPTPVPRKLDKNLRYYANNANTHENDHGSDVLPGNPNLVYENFEKTTQTKFVSPENSQKIQNYDNLQLHIKFGEKHDNHEEETLLPQMKYENFPEEANSSYRDYQNMESNRPTLPENCLDEGQYSGNYSNLQPLPFANKDKVLISGANGKHGDSDPQQIQSYPSDFEETEYQNM